MRSSKITTYYRLTKPERTFTNVMTAVAGYLFASRWHFGWNFLFLILGCYLVIASACVFNNYFDRNIDQKMERTKNRALASGKISTYGAIFFAAVITVIGFWLLA